MYRIHNVNAEYHPVTKLGYRAFYKSSLIPKFFFCNITFWFKASFATIKNDRVSQLWPRGQKQRHYDRKLAQGVIIGVNKSLQKMF
jgi:hypothetical protein